MQGRRIVFIHLSKVQPHQIRHGNQEDKILSRCSKWLQTSQDKFSARSVQQNQDSALSAKFALKVVLTPELTSSGIINSELINMPNTCYCGCTATEIPLWYLSIFTSTTALWTHPGNLSESLPSLLDAKLIQFPLFHIVKLSGIWIPFLNFLLKPSQDCSGMNTRPIVYTEVITPYHNPDSHLLIQED